jgi:hypothetical protein
MPKRCLISELQSGTFLANSSRETVRVMGVVSAMEDPPSEKDRQQFPAASADYNNQEIKLLILDDGTSAIAIWTIRSMIDSLSLQPGETVDCIVRLLQNATVKRWYTDTLIRVTDPDAESFRWMEVSSNNNSDNNNVCRRFGFPRIKRNTNEAYRLICVQTKLDDESGVSLEDLALVMRTSTRSVQEMIQELQISGQIYQNQKGNYVPL